MRTERGYHVEFADPGAAHNNSVMDVDAKIVASAMLGGVRVAGPSEIAAIDAPSDPSKERLLAKQARDMLPELNSHSMTMWMGRRPSLPVSLPFLCAKPDQPGLYTAFGHSRYGLMMAPKTRELIAGLVSGVAPNTDLSSFESHRFWSQTTREGHFPKRTNICSAIIDILCLARNFFKSKKHPVCHSRLFAK